MRRCRPSQPGERASDASTARRVDDRDDAQGAAAPAFDLHRERNHREVFEGQLIQIGEILEGGDVLVEEDAMAFEESGLPVVNAWRVEANRLDGAVFDEPARRLRVQTGEV